MGKSNLLILSLIGFLVEKKKEEKKKGKSIAISFELVVNGIHKGLCRRELEERTCLFFFWKNNDMSFRAEFHCDVRPGAERGSPPLDGQFAWCPGPARESIAKTCGKSGSPAGID